MAWSGQQVTGKPPHSLFLILIPSSQRNAWCSTKGVLKKELNKSIVFLPHNEMVAYDRITILHFYYNNPKNVDGESGHFYFVYKCYLFPYFTRMGDSSESWNRLPERHNNVIFNTPTPSSPCQAGGPSKFWRWHIQWFLSFWVFFVRISVFGTIGALLLVRDVLLRKMLSFRFFSKSSIFSLKLNFKPWISTLGKSCTSCPNWGEGGNLDKIQKKAFF